MYVERMTVYNTLIKVCYSTGNKEQKRLQFKVKNFLLYQAIS